jgi:hypothetical protein
LHDAGERSRRVVALAALVAGALTGATTVVVGSAVAQQSTAPARTYVEATHLPPLLTTGEDDVLLEYDAYCIDPEVDVGEPSCGVTGSVFLRVGTGGRFDELPLVRDVGSGRLVARVPGAIASARAGFTYYAELEATTGGDSLTLPAGGASAPQRSLPLGEATEIDLGTHRFGETARSDERVATAAWGNGPSEAGLEQGRSSTPIGASAFDVGAQGTIVLLDQVHRRLLRWRNGARAPERIAVDVDGTLADMALAPDETVYILETVGSRPGSVPLVRRFDSSGRALGSTEVAERTPSQIRHGPGGPVVHQQPSQQWMPITAYGSFLPPGEQRRRGSSGRPIGSGTEVIVLRTANETRVALAGPAGVRRAWRITSETALAEVQLADAYGDRLVVVVRVFSDHDDEFLVLVLGRTGLIRRLPVDSADWAETAPLGRFRLVGKSLYQLGSTPESTFVDRFDLEAR